MTRTQITGFLRSVSSLVLVLCAVTLAAQEMPRIEDQNLAGHDVVLPDAVAGNVAVLVFGFSKASKTPSSAWGRKITADYGGRKGFELYQLPVLEDVPRVIRGMVISGIKSGVPENLRDRFVPVLHGEAELKKLVNYKEADDAYIVVLDRAGKVVYQIHGALSDASYSQLRGQIESLLSGQR